jgi:hypothetical protein
MESPSKELEEETKLEKVLLLYVVVAAAIAVCFNLQKKKSNLDFYDIGSEASPAYLSLSLTNRR